MSLKSAITLNTRKIQIVAGLLASILVTAAAAQNNHREFFAQAFATRRAVAHRAQLGHLAQPENRVMDVYPTLTSE